jgi:myo-inositol-1(or 4)-monophosphatase
MAVATDACRAAGQLLYKTYLSGDIRAHVMAAHDVKLEADRTAERIISRIIRERRPMDGILAEESGAGRLERDGIWIIDPLDGTVNFSHGHPHFCISIAWLWRKQLCAGVIYDPVKDEMFTAARGCGAFCNGVRITPSTVCSLNRAMLSFGFGKDAPERRAVNDFNSLAKSVQRIRISGSAALDLAYVACGRYDAYYEPSVFVWDLAAGTLILEEAGGICSIWCRNELFGRICLASNAGLAPVLSEFLTLDTNHRARTCLDDIADRPRV